MGRMEDGSGDQGGYAFRGMYDGSVGVFLLRSFVYGMMWALACALWTALYYPNGMALIYKLVSHGLVCCYLPLMHRHRPIHCDKTRTRL